MLRRVEGATRAPGAWGPFGHKSDNAFASEGTSRTKGQSERTQAEPDID